jgi:hypothetical protein
MNNEDSWNHAVLIENTSQGKAWYVPVYFEPDEKLLHADVTCTMRNVQIKGRPKGLLVPGIKVTRWDSMDDGQKR